MEGKPIETCYPCIKNLSVVNSEIWKENPSKHAESILGELAQGLRLCTHLENLVVDVRAIPGRWIDILKEEPKFVTYILSYCFYHYYLFGLGVSILNLTWEQSEAKVVSGLIFPLNLS